MGMAAVRAMREVMRGRRIHFIVMGLNIGGVWRIWAWAGFGGGICCQT